MEPKIEIEYDQLSKTYNPGELIVGRVIIISNGSDIIITEITIRMEGKRVALLNPDKPEEFFLTESQLVVVDKETILPLDEMIEYPFHFQLPSELPASFRVSRAYVEYLLFVKLRRKLDFDLSYKSPFYINGVLKLDPIDNTSPIEIRQSKPVGCFSCLNFRSGHRFGVTVKLQRDQFIPGDRIDFVLDIWNCSKTTLRNVQISLVREVTILDAGNYHTVLKEYGVMSILYGPSVAPGSKAIWTSSPSNSDSENDSFQNSVLLIPEDTPPTHLGCQKFMELNYFVKISLQPSGLCSSSLLCKCPIVIGSARDC